MSIFNQIFQMNPFAKFFIKAKDHGEITREHFEDTNAQGVSQQQYDVVTQLQGSGYAYDQNYIDFNPVIDNKKRRILQYREMALSPEVNDALDNACNDAIQSDDDGYIAQVKFIDRPDKEIPELIKKRIRNAYEYIYHDVLNFNVNGYDLFRKFLIEAELYTEWITNNSGTNIIGYQVLPAFTTAPIYSNRGTKVDGYIQLLKDVILYNNNYTWQPQDNAILFQANQLTYISYPTRFANKLDVRGYLEPAIRVYNLLKAVEDAIVVYRLVRAPERRVWNIYTGGLPPPKAAEYINGLQKKYKKKLVYDSSTGTIDQTQNVQSILEDFWFAKDANGISSDVTVLQSGMNLGEITDLDYFLKKLYKSLKLPASRWADPTSQYSGGKIGEVTREEVRYGKFIANLQRRFKYLLLEPLFLILKMKGIDEKYISEGLIDIEFTQSNFFNEYLQLDLTATKLGVLASLEGKIWDAEANPAGMFHPDFVLRKFVGLSESDIEQNKKMIEESKNQDNKITTDTPPTEDMVPNETIPETAQPEAIAQESESLPEATPENTGMSAGEATDFTEGV